MSHRFVATLTVRAGSVTHGTLACMEMFRAPRLEKEQPPFSLMFNMLWLGVRKDRHRAESASPGDEKYHRHVRRISI